MNTETHRCLGIASRVLNGSFDTHSLGNSSETRLDQWEHLERAASDCTTTSPTTSPSLGVSVKWLLGPLTAEEALLDDSVPPIRNMSNLTVTRSFEHRFEYGQDLATPTSPYWG